MLLKLSQNHRKLFAFLVLVIVTLDAGLVDGKLNCDKFYDDFKCLATETDSADKFFGTATNKHSKGILIDVQNVVDLCTLLTPPTGASLPWPPPDKPPKSATAVSRAYTKDLAIAKEGKTQLKMEKPTKKGYCSKTIIRNCREEGSSVKIECAKLIDLS